MLMVLAVISIDLSPTGGQLATGSGDWQARVCESAVLIMGIYAHAHACDTGNYNPL